MASAVIAIFIQLPNRRADMREYVDTVVREWEVRRGELPGPVSTVYIGGGTPSMLPVSLIVDLLHGLAIKPDTLEEFTIEANPGGCDSRVGV